MMQQVFISYSRRDTSFANRLQTGLEEHGVNTWIDREGIHAGSKWSETIQDALDHSDVMIVVISPEAMASQNVRDEWQYFRDHDKPIIPVLHRPAKIHFQLNRIQYVDFNDQPFTTALTQLIRELEHLHIPTTTPPQPVRRRPRYLSGAVIVVAILVLALVGVVGLSSIAQPVTLRPTHTNVQLAMTATFPSADYEPENTLMLRVTVPFANLRSGPGVNYDVLATAIEGDELEALGWVRGFNDDLESVVWYFIEHPIGERVWIMADIVEPLAAPEATRFIATPPSSGGAE